MALILFAIFFAVFFKPPILSAKSSNVSCLNEYGQPVEWYIIYKLPKLPKNTEGGTAYLFMDSENQFWTKSNYTIDKEGSAVGKTLSRMYDAMSNEDLIILQYNNEWPDGKHRRTTRGHTKGVFLGSSLSGFWLVHSVPKFPPWANTSYDYPKSGHIYGQTCFCMSVSQTQYDLIGLQLLYNTPYVYDFNMPESLSQKYPNLFKAMKSKHVKVAPWFHEQVYSGLNNTEFFSFAKSANFQKDLYSAFVAPSLKIDMVAETWQNGVGYLESACKGNYTVLNSKGIKFEDLSIDFNSSHDHSKWAVSLLGQDPWVCIGDINRMTTQFDRGGGTVCMKNQKVWKAFETIIFQTEACKIWT